MESWHPLACFVSTQPHFNVCPCLLQLARVGGPSKDVGGPGKDVGGSGVARVSSARGPMLASAPPPPKGARPPPPFGKSCIRPWGKNRQAKTKKKGLQQEKGTFAARLIRHCNEVTLIICLGLIFNFNCHWLVAPATTLVAPATTLVAPVRTLVAPARTLVAPVRMLFH